MENQELLGCVFVQFGLFFAIMPLKPTFAMLQLQPGRGEDCAENARYAEKNVSAGGCSIHLYFGAACGIRADDLEVPGQQ